MVNNNLVFENCKICSRNFSGKPTQYNKNGGVREFSVMIYDIPFAERLIADGWNVKIYIPRDMSGNQNGDAVGYLNVAVNFSNIPPRIVMVTSTRQTPLDEETVGMLDYAEIQNVDLEIRPYNWEVNGKHGVKAYVKTMYVTIYEDAFAGKYGDIPASQYC